MLASVLVDSGLENFRGLLLSLVPELPVVVSGEVIYSLRLAYYQLSSGVVVAVADASELFSVQ